MGRLPETSPRAGAYIIEAAEVEALLGGPLTWVFNRILRGGKSGHPLKDPVRYRWDKESDSYTLRPSKDVPASRLFRRNGQWRITFETPETLAKDTHLFEETLLDEPVFSIVAILYAIQTTLYPALRSKAMQRILQEDM